MVMCWVPECKHYNVRETCKFFSFPKPGKKERKKWIKLIRRDDEPGSGAFVCSCHFRGGLKENLPELFKRNVNSHFGEHYLSPERKKTRRARTKGSEENFNFRRQLKNQEVASVSGVEIKVEETNISLEDKQDTTPSVKTEPVDNEVDDPITQVFTNTKSEPIDCEETTLESCSKKKDELVSHVPPTNIIKPEPNDHEETPFESCSSGKDDPLSTGAKPKQIIYEETPFINSAQIYQTEDEETIYDSTESSNISELDILISRMFYANRIPFHVVEEDNFVKMIAGLCSGYKPPDKKRLSGELLDLEYNRVMKISKSQIAQSDYVRLAIDVDYEDELVSKVNFIVYTSRPIFYKSVSTRNDALSKEYLYKLSKEVIEELGPLKVNTIVDGNIPVVAAIRRLVLADYPHIFFCAKSMSDLNFVIRQLRNDAKEKDKLTDDIMTKLHTVEYNLKCIRSEQFLETALLNSGSCSKSIANTQNNSTSEGVHRSVLQSKIQPLLKVQRKRNTDFTKQASSINPPKRKKVGRPRNKRTNVMIEPTTSNLSYSVQPVQKIFVVQRNEISSNIAIMNSDKNVHNVNVLQKISVANMATKRKHKLLLPFPATKPNVLEEYKFLSADTEITDNEITEPKINSKNDFTFDDACEKRFTYVANKDENEFKSTMGKPPELYSTSSATGNISDEQVRSISKKIYGELLKHKINTKPNDLPESSSSIKTTEYNYRNSCN